MLHSIRYYKRCFHSEVTFTLFIFLHHSPLNGDGDCRLTLYFIYFKGSFILLTFMGCPLVTIHTYYIRIIDILQSVFCFPHHLLWTWYDSAAIFLLIYTFLLNFLFVLEEIEQKNKLNKKYASHKQRTNGSPPARFFKSNTPFLLLFVSGNIF